MTTDIWRELLLDYASEQARNIYSHVLLSSFQLSEKTKVFKSTESHSSTVCPILSIIKFMTHLSCVTSCTGYYTIKVIAISVWKWVKPVQCVESKLLSSSECFDLGNNETIQFQGFFLLIKVMQNNQLIQPLLPESIYLLLFW